MSPLRRHLDDTCVDTYRGAEMMLVPRISIGR
ncbi:hypothetical protein BOS5A_210629 [Bosea sp. EC-HK365B]|nr:hypothetical protein BOS5A_210629 [Bosea sp. EC-HK365B]